MNALGRRARQFKNRFRHLAKLGRPIYPPQAGRSVAESIAIEKRKAQRMAAASGKKKK